MGFGDFMRKIFTAPGRERAKSVKRQFSVQPKASMGATGSYGNTNLATGEQFYRGLSSLPNSLSLDHWSLRHNVRNMMYSAGPAKSIVERFAQFEANTGLKLRVAPNAEILGISESEAEEWGKNFSTRFNLWAMNKLCSLDNQQNLYEAQYFYSVQQHRDNDIFIRFHYTNNNDLLNPLQFQFLDPDQIAMDAITCTAGTYPNYWDGIERDKNRVETGYNVVVTDEKYNSKTVKISRKTRNGMIKMIHAFKKDFPGQGRGYPEMSNAIQSFSNLTGFTIAQIQKAINQSNIVFVSENDQQNPSNVLETELEARGPRPSDYVGSDPVVAEEITDEEIMQLSLLPEFNISQPGSVYIANSKRGDKLKSVENTAPADRYDAFVNSFITNLAADVSMPVEVLLMKFGENYSASRATLVLFWRLIEIGQANMAWDFLNVLVEMWAMGEIAAGRIKAQGWSDPILRQAWLQCRWIGTPMPEIDPLKAAKAAKERAEIGHETLDDGALNHNGSDGQANRAQLTREYQELPIAPWSANANQDNDFDENGDEVKNKDDEDDK